MSSRFGARFGKSPPRRAIAIGTPIRLSEYATARPRRGRPYGGKVRLSGSPRARWRMGFKGLAAAIATGWDTQLSPIDIRSLTPAQDVRDVRGLTFLLEPAKTGRAAAGTLSRRSEMIVDFMSPASASNCWPIRRFFAIDRAAPTQRIRWEMISALCALPYSDRKTRTLADFRRSGAIEAAAGGADAGTIAAKMANTLSASNAFTSLYPSRDDESASRR